MRYHAALINQPHRDLKHKRFSITNNVWQRKLNRFEFVLFSFLCYHSSHDLNATLTTEVIARSVHMATSTVKKYLSTLIKKGLITDEWEPAPDFQCKESKSFFTLPSEIFLLNLPPSAFMVYAYLLLIEDRRTHTCHPSYNTIAANTGMSKNTALKNIGILSEAGLISVEPSSYFDKHGMKWKGNNLYTILPISHVISAFYQQQLHQLELASAKHNAQAQSLPHSRPCTASCGTEQVNTHPHGKSQRAGFVAEICPQVFAGQRDERASRIKARGQM